MTALFPMSRRDRRARRCHPRLTGEDFRDAEIDGRESAAPENPSPRASGGGPTSPPALLQENEGDGSGT